MDFTFAAIDIKINDKERKQILDEVTSVPDSMYHYNEFRGCKMLGIYNGGGQLGGREPGKNTSKGEFKYTPAGLLCPITQKILETKIFPFMDPIGRVTILRTSPNTGLNIHLDSTVDEVGTRQHKFRLVLNGNIRKLYFIDKYGNKVFVPEHYTCYTMDGTHPHSIDPDPEEKITLCIGVPWRGNDTDLYKNLINDSLFKMKVSYPNIIEEEWLDPFFKVKK